MYCDYFTATAVALKNGKLYYKGMRVSKNDDFNRKAIQNNASQSEYA